ncbi:hypothetical protein HYR99_05480 [Candidatus Poribacteria bacterium]|nr:hypothetical protein [Candidatus Poribacteria bacterium]
MSKKANLYIGRAGQMAVMAEFLIRGYNVAIPEVDIGDDIFAVQNSTGEYSRIQVKTALARKTKTGYSARYSLKLSQLETPTVPDTWYVFANRISSYWESFLVIPRPELYNQYNRNNVGSVNQGGVLSLYFSYADEKVTCSGQDFSMYLNNWSAWPAIAH